MTEKHIHLPDLHKFQLEIGNSPHRFRVISCGRRWGKTFLAMILTMWEMMIRFERTKKKQRAWVIAPTFPLVREDWLTAEIVLKNAIVNKKQTEMRMDICHYGFIEFKSAEREDEGLRGAGLDFAVVDEASRVSRKSWEQGIRPALSDKLGRCLFISTPKGRNWFYEFWLKGQKDNSEVKSWQYPTYTNPYFPQEEWKDIKLSTPELILQQEYLADFLEDSASVFKNLPSCYRGDLEPNKEGERYHIGVDLGKAEDFTVITVMKESTSQLVYIQRFNKIDWSLQKKQIQSVARTYRDSIAYIDSTGLGDPIEEDLRKSGVNARGYKFTNTSKQALIEQLIVAIEQGLLGIPNINETKFLIEELKAFSYDMLPSGKIRYSAPEGLHDDGVISLGLAIKGMHFALHKIADEKQNKLPKFSPAWIEQEWINEECSRMNRLPRRYRREVPEPSLS